MDSSGKPIDGDRRPPLDAREHLGEQVTLSTAELHQLVLIECGLLRDDPSMPFDFGWQLSLPARPPHARRGFGWLRRTRSQPPDYGF